jgi:hypothetical protein
LDLGQVMRRNFKLLLTLPPSEAYHVGMNQSDKEKGNTMSADEANKIKDVLWTEIRQYVLDDGPAVESLDAILVEYGDDFPDDARESLVATLIAKKCAEIASLSEGPMHNAPLAFVFNSWVAQQIAADHNA